MGSVFPWIGRKFGTAERKLPLSPPSRHVPPPGTGDEARMISKSRQATPKRAFDGGDGSGIPTSPGNTKPASRDREVDTGHREDDDGGDGSGIPSS
jgi:hypothetical protein